MSHLLKLLFSLLFLIGIQSVSFAQYKRMSVGLTTGTNNFSNNYNSYGMSLQYNFKKIFSIKTCYDYGKSKAYCDYFWDLSPMRTYSYDINSRYHDVSFFGRATFGRKICVLLDAGILMSYAANSKYTYTIDYMDHDMIDVIEYRIDKIGIKKALGIIGGVGVLFPIKNKVFLSFEMRHDFLNDRYDNSYQNNGLHYEYYSDVHSFKGTKFFLELSYQFNWSKKSNYTFTTYYPTFKENED